MNQSELKTLTQYSYDSAIFDLVPLSKISHNDIRKTIRLILTQNFGISWEMQES